MGQPGQCPASLWPPVPASTSAVKALEEDAVGVPCPGTDLYTFQGTSTLLSKVRSTLAARVEGPAAQVRGLEQRWCDVLQEKSLALG